MQVSCTRNLHQKFDASFSYKFLVQVSCTSFLYVCLGHNPVAVGAAATCLRLCRNNRSDSLSVGKHRHKKCCHKASTTEDNADVEMHTSGRFDYSLPVTSHDNQRAVDNWIITREKCRMAIAGLSCATRIKILLARQRRLARDTSLDPLID